jgi:hypothetical protein
MVETVLEATRELLRCLEAGLRGRREQPVLALRPVDEDVHRDRHAGLPRRTSSRRRFDGIDRTPTAWVLYNSGELFKVNTQTAACEPTSFSRPEQPPELRHGFSTDAPGSTADTLFIAGGPISLTMGATSTLATVNMTTMAPSSLGTVTGWPELTGTGNAELWGFFPSATVAPRIEKLNKATGAALQTFPLSTLSGQPAAWAFAAWGGDFWIFLQREPTRAPRSIRSTVRTARSRARPRQAGRRIVGAGVSTCAPTVIRVAGL